MRPYASQQMAGNAPARGKPFSQSHAPAAKTERQSQKQPQQQSRYQQISDEQRSEIEDAFQLFDLDKDGLVDHHELKVALKALGFTLDKPSLLDILRAYGKVAPSYKPRPNAKPTDPISPVHLHLSLQDFQECAAQLILERDPMEEIDRAFSLFDTEGKGIITIDDLRRVAGELNEGMDDDELQAMIEEFDIEGRGGVDLEEFRQICMT